MVGFVFARCICVSSRLAVCFSVLRLAGGVQAGRLLHCHLSWWAASAVSGSDGKQTWQKQNMFSMAAVFSALVRCLVPAGDAAQRVPLAGCVRCGPCSALPSQLPWAAAADVGSADL